MMTLVFGGPGTGEAMSSRPRSIRSGFVVLGNRDMVDMGDEWLTQEVPIPDTMFVCSCPNIVGS